MAEVKSNLVKLAKGSSSKKTATTTRKSTKKVEEKPLTPEEKRDLKAKQKVKELLEDVDLTPKKESEDLLELDEGKGNKSIEWLEEQLTALSDINTKLKGELEVAKGDYTKLFNEFQRLKQSGSGVVLTNADVDTPLKANLVRLFNEIQTNHLTMGKNFVIVPPAFLNRLIMFFPFLESEKRF